MITGIFVEECNNRFLCKVKVEGVIHECYVSSSSKLEKYIKVKGRKVMLEENSGKNLRTKFTLKAVSVKGKWVLLNLNSLNSIYLEHIIKQDKYNVESISKEVFIDEYKTDFYIEQEKLLIEVKGLLSETEKVIYPIVSCGRTYRQLLTIKKKLEQGYKADYVFILMNNIINTIEFNKNEPELIEMFNECVDLGMNVKFCQLRWYNGKCSIKKYKLVNIIA